MSASPEKRRRTVPLAAVVALLREIARTPRPRDPAGTDAAAIAGAEARGWIAADAGGILRPTRSGREALRKTATVRTVARAAGSAGPPAAGARPVHNPAESPIAWLASRRDASGKPLLTSAQVAAGERLRADLTFAELMPRVTMSWSGIPGGGASGSPSSGVGDLRDNVVAARHRVTAALRAVGPELADILIDVCGHLRGLEDIAHREGWPRRAARLVLERALTALARHYGLEPAVDMDTVISRRLRHWGADGYRPTLDRWRGGAQDD